MTSMRRARRRLLVWRRYAHRTYWNPTATRPAWSSLDLVIAPGHRRAWEAVEQLTERRLYAGRLGPNGECYCGGCIGMGPCDDDLGHTDDDRCCAVGAYGHDGPCTWRCTLCAGSGRCPACGDQLDFCDECGASGSCWECGGEGHLYDDTFLPTRPVVTIDTRELL